MKQIASSRQFSKSMRRLDLDEPGALRSRLFSSTSIAGASGRPPRRDRVLGSAVRGGLGRLAALLLLVAGCEQPLDAGSTRPHGLLPADERSAIVITNDGFSDNWQGEYAMLLANGGGPKIAGIVVNANYPWPNLDDNVSGWRAMVTAARQSGLRDIPDPTASVSSALKRPTSGKIEDTTANRSEGALLILEASSELSQPYRPLVVVTGGRLTDVADAYLIDPTVAQRVVVVSSLGTISTSGGVMSNPNGEMDPWADAIVAARFRYVQVSAYYDQLTDVPESRVSELPKNAFGTWIAAKQPGILKLREAADQVGIVAIGLPNFAVTVESVAASGLVGAGAKAGPDLLRDPAGGAQLVTGSAGALATARFWELLLRPSTFEH